jgi:hypothetical protein
MWERAFMTTFFALMMALWLAVVWFFLVGPNAPALF